MAGLVVKHLVKAPRSGCVHQLKVNTGQQVFDNNVLFVIEIVDGSSSRHEVKVTPLGQNDFRTEIDDLSIDINVAVYNKYVVKAPHSGRVHQLKVNTSQ
ncbi:hypothetical protein Syun_029256 [Stephania yunnanensis]|uniref:Methylcrotonoyl-CoA carboxylase subunit alpha BT domain-containing protein n=1 Tax=Stephania yunnanensis TaxID=152371 RepID=A0AAP0HJA6_9MAGN